jgi:hypothetical protein
VVITDDAVVFAADLAVAEEEPVAVSEAHGVAFADVDHASRDALEGERCFPVTLLDRHRLFGMIPLSNVDVSAFGEAHPQGSAYVCREASSTPRTHANWSLR